jgi:sensor histidine kinase regulating citrate/malate metabolism
MLTALALFIGFVCGLYVGVAVPLFVEMWVSLTFITYFVEKKFKKEFYQLKKNKTLKRFKQILHSIPEGVLIFDTQKGTVVMSNSELERIIMKYASA